MPRSKVLTRGTCTKRCYSIENFLKSIYMKSADTFSWSSDSTISKGKQHPISDVEPIALRGPHGKIPVRVLYPKSGENKRKDDEAGALVNFYSGVYTVSSIDEFESGLRLFAEESGSMLLYPQYRMRVLLNRVGEGGKARGVHPDRVAGSGDSAGGNMTAAVSLRRNDENKKPLAEPILLYPEARLPFDTSAANHYLPRGTPPRHRYISPGMQLVGKLQELPQASVYTSGFDPLRDVGFEYANKLESADNEVVWRHHDGMTRGWLQMTAWSSEAVGAMKDVAGDLKKLAY